MTVTRGFVITLFSGLSCAILGTLLGFGIGTLAPDYYRMVFRIPPGVPLNPIHVGLGLGLTQGLTVGLVIGLVIVVVVAWHDIKKATTPT
jgi:hypothetical protein